MELNTPKQLPNFNYLGLHDYTISVAAFFGRKEFTSDETKNLLEKTLLSCAADDGFEVVAFALLPSKVRFLCRGKEKDADLRGLVEHFKRKTEREWRKRHNEPLWLPGYWDHVLRKKEPVEEFVNAIRSGERLPIGFVAQAAVAVAA